MSYRIIKKIEEVKHWPDQKMFKCLVKTQGKEFTRDILPEEYELLIAIQNLNNSDINDLFDKVEKFGQARWCEGSADAEDSFASQSPDY